jgi:hypothetical protein
VRSVLRGAFTSAHAVGGFLRAPGAALLLGGVGLGALTAFSALTALVTLVRSRFGPRLLATVDLVAGAGLLGFAGLLGWRTAQDA